MKIIGNYKPYTGETYQYKMTTDANADVKVETWQITYNKKILKESKKGEFNFSINIAGKTLTLIAKVKNKTGKLVDYSTEIIPLAGKPKIHEAHWRDINGKVIENAILQYLDTAELKIKISNILDNKIIKVVLYEKEKIGEDTNMSAQEIIVRSNRAYYKLPLTRVMADKLKKRDQASIMGYEDEIHHYYVEIYYENKLLYTGENYNILNVRNEIGQTIYPQKANMPVVVYVAPPAKHSQKTQKELIFNIFFDGTQNNMNNTEKRLEGSHIYTTYSNKKNDSYKNYYSNIALLYKTINETYADNVINIYTEGVGTRNNLSDESTAAGTGMNNLIATSGIESKIAKVIKDIKLKHEEYKKIKKITPSIFIFNLFGFSRGAATARYFMSLESRIRTVLGIKGNQRREFNFVGLFDTVASYGLDHKNDVENLKLDSVSKAKKVFHLTAGDEYRDNFKLTTIKNAIDKGVGYELEIPGAHSDVGGGYQEKEEERIILASETSFSPLSPEKLVKLRKEYIAQGWYTSKEIDINTRELKIEGESRYTHLLIGNRVIPYYYQHIGYHIMREFAKKYAGIVFDNELIRKYKIFIPSDLKTLYDTLLSYAKANDKAQRKKIVLTHRDLWVRNKYLHISSREYELFMGASKDENRKPKRGELDG